MTYKITLETVIFLLILISSSLACHPYCKYCAEDGVTCDGCYAGYIFSPDTPTSCEPCPGGYTSEESSRICTACPAGTYSAFGQLICWTCPSGYSSEEGSEVCTRCPNGSYATAGQLCQPCPAGTYAVDDGSHCEYCPSGYFSAGGARSCSLCPAGSVPDVYQWGCVDCEAGLWANSGESECINCGPSCETCESSTTCKECAEYAENINGKCLYSCPQGEQGERMNVSFGDCVNGACGQGCQECAYDGFDCFSCFPSESENSSRAQTRFLVCSLPLLENPTATVGEEEKDEISLKSVTKSTGSGLDVASVIAKSISAGSSVAFRFGVVAEVIRNARYFSIAYSEKTVNIFADEEPFEINAPGSFERKDSKELHQNFVKYDVKPNFLINYWNNLITILILSACLGILKVLEIYLNQNEKKIWTRRVLRILKISAANFLINNLYGSFDQILLFFIFEVQTFSFVSAFSLSSFICALIFMIIGLGFFGFNFYILKQYQKAKSQQIDQENNNRKKLEMFKSKHACVKVFYEDFKDDSLIKQSFLASLVIRSCILNVSLCLLVDHPLVEACLYLGVNLAFALFLIIKRPFEEFKNAAAQYFCEIIILITYTGVLALAVMDHNGSGGNNSRESLEKAIVILGIVLNIGGVIFQCIAILAGIYEAYQWFKALRSKAKVVANPPVKALAKNAAEDMKESARPLNLDDPSSTPSNQNLSEGVGAGLVSLSGLSFRIKSKTGLEMPFPSTSQSLNNLLTGIEGSQNDLDRENNKPVLSRNGTIREEGADGTMSPYKNGVSERVMRRKGPFTFRGE